MPGLTAGGRGVDAHAVDQPCRAPRWCCVLAGALSLLSAIVVGCASDSLPSIGAAAMAAAPAGPVPASIAVSAGGDQVGLAGNRLAAPVVLTVSDAGGDPVRNVPVSLRVASGRAVLSVEQSVTDAHGRVAVEVQLGAAGTVVGVAAVPGFKDLAPAAFTLTALEAPQLFAGAGVEAPHALQQLVARIGGANNGANPPALASGRREIDWDAVLLDGTDFEGASPAVVAGHVVEVPVNRFQGRGALFERAVRVADEASAGLHAFSGGKLVPPSEEKLGVGFVRASAPSASPTSARVAAFGAVFVDPDRTRVSTVELFAGPNSLGRYEAPVGASGQASFIGALWPSAVITRVELVTGQAALDDLVYPEPQ